METNNSSSLSFDPEGSQTLNGKTPQAFVSSSLRALQSSSSLSLSETNVLNGPSPQFHSTLMSQDRSARGSLNDLQLTTINMNSIPSKIKKFFHCRLSVVGCQFKKGFTIIETMVGISVLVIVAVGVLGAFNYLSRAVSVAQAKVAVVSVLNDEIELLRNLPYQDAGVARSIPTGVLSRTGTASRSGFNFLITRTIRNIDDPFDGILGGSPNDTAPADYKLVEIQADCLNCASPITSKQTTTIAPKNLEISSGGGALFIRVFDANGLPVPQASVRVFNNKLSPNLLINDVTNNQGILQLVDVPPSVGGYNTTITKSGYSTDGTYPPGGSDNPNPTTGDSTVAAGVVTQISFAIDRVSTINVSTTNQVCAATPFVAFRIDGSKLIGTPDKLKYSQAFVSDAQGTKTLSDMEWDLYMFFITGATYDLAGSIPLLPMSLAPNTTQGVQLLVNPKNPKSLLVMVKDSGTGLPISGATVSLSKTGFLTQSLTGYGSLLQTDWSGGSGQATFTDSARYFDQNGDIDTASPAGEIKLRKVFGDYQTLGYLTSSAFDTGAVSNFSNIFWQPQDQPPETGIDPVKFQVASNNDNTAWNFVGPDNALNTYYTLANTDLSNHNGKRYLRYRVFLSTADVSKTPNVSNVSITFTSSCVPPGQAFFNGLPAGTYTFSVTHPSYQAYTDPSFSTSPDFQTADITLSP